MNTFEISKNLSTELEELPKKNGFVEKFTRPELIGTLLPVAPIVAPAGIAAKLIRENKKNHTVISSTQELEKYVNCFGERWQNDVVYVEHPFHEGVLIDVTKYRDRILKEMITDISCYIMDAFPLKSITVGLNVSKNTKTDVDVSVETIETSAHGSVKIDKNYYYSVKNSVPTEHEAREYTWIKQFPNIINAVEHKSLSMENFEQISTDLSVGFEFKEVFKSKFGFFDSQKRQLFVSYEMAE